MQPPWCFPSIDDAIGRAIVRLHVPRSCVIALVNGTRIRWQLADVQIRRGDAGDAPPAQVEPWSAAVFSARNLAARAGAGCAGTVRYRSVDGLVLEVTFDVPYAGSAVAEIGTGTPPAPLRRCALREAAGGTVVFRLRVPPDPSSCPPPSERRSLHYD